MADYVRNLEAKREFDSRSRGRRERDQNLSSTTSPNATPAISSSSTMSAGPAASRRRCRLRSTVASRRQSKQALDDMRFEKPAYVFRRSGAVTEHPLHAARADVSVKVAGDFMSTESVTPGDAAGSGWRQGCRSAETEELPADFRHFEVTLTLSAGFAATENLRRRDLVTPCAQGRHAPDDARRAASAKRSTRSPSMPRPIRCGRWRGSLSGRAGPETDRHDPRHAAERSRIATTAPTSSCVPLLVVPAKPMLSGIAPEVVAAHRRAPSSATATGWTSRQRRSVVFSENHALACSTPPPISPGAILPERTCSSVRDGLARSSRRSGLSGCAPGWTISRNGDGRVQPRRSIPDRPQGLDHADGALAPDADVRERSAVARSCAYWRSWRARPTTAF